MKTKRIHPDFLYEITIAGIPCHADVISSTPFKEGNIFAAPGDSEPDELAEVEFEVYDRKGYPAPWLERKMTAAEKRDIESQLIDQLFNNEPEL